MTGPTSPRSLVCLIKGPKSGTSGHEWQSNFFQDAKLATLGSANVTQSAAASSSSDRPTRPERSTRALATLVRQLLAAKSLTHSLTHSLMSCHVHSCRAPRSSWSTSGRAVPARWRRCLHGVVLPRALGWVAAMVAALRSSALGRRRCRRWSGSSRSSSSVSAPAAAAGAMGNG